MEVGQLCTVLSPQTLSRILMLIRGLGGANPSTESCGW